MDNETWVIEAGDLVIEKKARVGIDGLTTWERLVYSLWAADYGMRNAGDLDTARDVYADFQPDALRAADALSLPATRGAFGLDPGVLEKRYFDLFEVICDEVRSAEQGVAGDRGPQLL